MPTCCRSKSPPGSYKLLSSDYDWLADPSKAGGAAAQPMPKSKPEAPLPDPPLQLQQTR